MQSQVSILSIFYMCNLQMYQNKLVHFERVLNYIRLERPARDKHSILSDELVINEENEVLWIQSQVSILKLFYICSLWMCQNKLMHFESTALGNVCNGRYSLFCWAVSYVGKNIYETSHWREKEKTVVQSDNCSTDFILVHWFGRKKQTLFLTKKFTIWMKYDTTNATKLTNLRSYLIQERNFEFSLPYVVSYFPFLTLLF